MQVKLFIHKSMYIFVITVKVKFVGKKICCYISYEFYSTQARGGLHFIIKLTITEASGQTETAEEEDRRDAQGACEEMSAR